jgi:hypothetical protein
VGRCRAHRALDRLIVGSAVQTERIDAQKYGPVGCCIYCGCSGGAKGLTLIRARTGEGRERAKRRGKPNLTPQQRSDLLCRLAEGEETRVEQARRYNVHPSTISRLTA